MGKKIKKDIDIIVLHKYIKGLEIAVKKLDILTSIEVSFVRYDINLVDILDEKERELS